jgi:hypothetical protein
MSYYYLNEAQLKESSIRFVSSEGELTTNQIDTINLVIDKQKPSSINYIFDRDLAGERFALKTTAGILSKQIAPFNISLSNPGGQYHLKISSANADLIVIIVDRLERLNKESPELAENPFHIYNISHRKDISNAEILFPAASSIHFSLLNDILIERINNSPDSNLKITRLRPATKDFNQDLQAAILNTLPSDGYTDSSYLQSCRQSDCYDRVLRNYSDNHHFDFSHPDSYEYLNHFKKQHSRKDSSTPILAVSFLLDNTPQEFSPDKFISDLKTKSGLSIESSFFFITPSNNLVVFMNTNQDFLQDEFSGVLDAHLNTNSIKKYSLKYLPFSDFQTSFNINSIIMTKKKETSSKTASETKKANAASKDQKSPQKAEKAAAIETPGKEEKTNYPLAYGWQNENKFDKDYPFYNASMEIDKFSSLETDEHGLAHLSITLRKEPTEKGQCNVNVYQDDYHKTKQHNKYASLFVSVKVDKVLEALKEQNAKYVSLSMGPVKDKDKFDYYVKLTNDELDNQLYVGSGITNKQCLIKSIPNSEKNFLGKATAKQFENGSISINVSIPAQKLSDLEVGPNGEHELSLGVDRGKNNIDVYENSFRKDSIIDLDKIVSLNINKDQLDKAEIEHNNLSFELNFKKPESIKKDKFDMSCKAFKSASEKPYVGRAKTEVNFANDIIQILSSEKAIQMDNQKSI